MSAPASNLSSSLTNSSSQSSLLASRSSSSQLQLSTSSLPARSTSPAAVQSGSPASDESLSSDWHADESPPDDVHGVHDDSGVFGSMTDSQFITHEKAAEAAAAVHASAATVPRPSSSQPASASATLAPATVASTASASVSAAPSEDSAAAASSANAAVGAFDPQKDSSWLSAIKGVQEKDRAESKEADSKEAAQPQAAAVEHKDADEKQEEASALPPAPQPAAAADVTKAVGASDSVVPSGSADSSPTLYSRVSSLLSSFSSSPVLPGALLSISLLAVGFCLGRVWQRRQYSLAAQQHADTVHRCLTTQQRRSSSSASHIPFSRGGTGTGEAGGGGGLIDSTRRLVSAIMGEQEKEVSRWLGLLQDGVLTPVMVRYIQ